MNAEPRSVFVSASDGLKLHARCYGLPGKPRLPVVCLPGLTRNVADFDTLATALAHDSGRPRRVIAIDYRGRGQSEYDRNPANYSLPVEVADVLTVLTALEAMPAIFIGTSRGGILALLLATVQPTAIAGVLLNDIGPVIDPAGLTRIRGYVGKLPRPASFEDAAEVFRRMFGAQFPKLTAEDWLIDAKRTFKQENGHLVPNYDVKLSTTLASLDLEQPLPTLWAEFDALAQVPLMVVRGANSDILSAQTVDAMRTRRPDTETIEVPDQGHAPLLSGPDMIARIAEFCDRCDRAKSNLAK